MNQQKLENVTKNVFFHLLIKNSLKGIRIPGLLRSPWLQAYAQEPHRLDC